jgi:hypothetical protein
MIWRVKAILCLLCKRYGPVSTITIIWQTSPARRRCSSRGLDLGGNQATLLKKIEELTLYAVEQDKRLGARQKEIDGLKELVRKLAAK